jgi:predicted lipoprotein with Yx(FWY)xxD motif
MKRAILVALVAAWSCSDPSNAIRLETHTGPFGDYITDTNGRPVYAFSGDAPNQTACLTNCATVWPPVLVEARPPAASPAIDTARLRVFARPDGTHQLAYAGLPLYYSASSFTSRDALGHYAMSFGGRFTLVSPAGKPLPPPK